jgi:hypothetical protein
MRLSILSVLLFGAAVSTALTFPIIDRQGDGGCMSVSILAYAIFGSIFMSDEY